MLQIYIFQLLFFSPQWDDTKADSFILKVVEIHWNMLVNLDFKFAIMLLTLEVFAVLLMDRVVEATVAISRGFTINELKKSWSYKYLF